MTCLKYHQNQLYIEQVPLKHIAHQVGTPTYIYSSATLKKNWQAFAQAFAELPHRICYAVKANSNLSILRLLAEMGSGFDIVSLGELERVIAAGGNPSQVVFSGVGKKTDEIEGAILKGIDCFDVESERELYRLNHIASNLGKKIHIALRVNPDVDPKTHSYISTGLSENKFGIQSDEILPICRRLHEFPALSLAGLAAHIGSQIVDVAPFLLSIDRLLGLYEELKHLGIKLHHINIGGGLGITYRHEQPPSIDAYAQAIKAKLAGYPLKLMLEPGRAIVGEAGVLLTQIEYIKETSNKSFAIVDAGMNDLLRPALYEAWQNILEVQQHRNLPARCYDIAGPVCESADFLGKNRSLAIQEGDFLAVDTAGAYGFCMSSNYNSRARPAEVLVEKDHYRIIRPRESLTQLFESEKI